MRQPIHVLADDERVEDAARRMREANVDLLPVRDASNALVGVLTLRDVVFGVVAAGRPRETMVRDVMTTDLVTCRLDDPFFRAQELMRERGVAFVMCVDDVGAAAGIIDLAEVARHEDGFRLAKTVRKALQRDGEPPSSASRGAERDSFSMRDARRGG